MFLFAFVGLAEAAFVSIAEPKPNSVAYGAHSDERNRQAVRVVLHYYDLHLIPNEEREKLSVWFRVDRGQTLRLGPPLPGSILELSMRYGTHIIEAAFTNSTSSQGVNLPEDVSVTDIATTTFDLLPRVGEGILRSSRKPRRAGFDDDGGQRGRPLHVVLVGSLALGGQAMLALEQARRLPQMKLPDGRRAFEITYASSSGSSGEEPLRFLLEALPGVKVVKYGAVLSAELGATPETIGAMMARYETRDQLPALLLDAARDLMDILETADVVSFTNHEEYLSVDEYVVECARLARVPRILNEPSNLWWGDLPTRSKRKEESDELRLVDGLILPSQFAADFWARRGATVPLYVINPGVELIREDDRSAFGEDGVVRIAFVGRLAPQKSPGIFIRAAASVAALYSLHATPRVRFVVIGDGPLKQPMENLARDLGLDVDFVGWLPPNRVRDAIRNFTDVVVHTNVLEETFCMCNVEAMAEDRLVVSYGVGGVSEYLNGDDEHGIVVETPSVPALVAALIKVVENPSRYAAFGRLAGRRVRGMDGGNDLSFSRMAREYASMYSSFFSSSRDEEPSTLAGTLQDTLSRVANVSCGGGEDESLLHVDPGLLLEAGKYWESACSIAHHTRQIGQDSNSLLQTRHVDSLHALSLSLAMASEVFVKSESPPRESRAATSLRLLSAVAETGIQAAKQLALPRRIPAFARIAATARSACGGTPDTAAALFYDVVIDRRGNAAEELNETATTEMLLADLEQSGVKASQTGITIGIGDGSERSIELRLSDASDAGGSKFAAVTSLSKLRHDADQLKYLAETRTEPNFAAERIILSSFRSANMTLSISPEIEKHTLFRELSRVYERVANLCKNIASPDDVTLVSLRDVARVLSDAEEEELAVRIACVCVCVPREVSRRLSCWERTASCCMWSYRKASTKSIILYSLKNGNRKMLPETSTKTMELHSSTTYQPASSTRFPSFTRRCSLGMLLICFETKC